MIRSKKLIKIKDLKHCFFSSIGGHSKNIYKSLNCGSGSKDNKKNIKKNFENIEEANAYNRKCRACYGWQTSASKALLELCKAFENIIDCLVRCDAFVYLLTTLLNVRNYHGQQVAHEILIMIVDYVPEILDKTPGKYSEATVLLNPTVSKLHPPLYELKTDIPIFDIIFSKP